MTFRLVSAALAAVLAVATARGENWPQWRGPRGDSTSTETDLPLAWTSESGIAWIAPLPGWGGSTPAIWDDAIFVTSHDDERDEPGKLLLLRLDKKTGKIVWTRQVGTGVAVRDAEKRSKQKFHQLQNLASPSPVTDGQHVVVHFGNGLLAAYDFDGRELWKRNLQDDYGAYTIWWGHANSPVLYPRPGEQSPLVISVCMQDSLADRQEQPVESYLVAHDVATGREIWKTPRMTDARAEECDAYTTPVLRQVGDRHELIVMGGNQVDAYDPATGKQIWFLPKLVGGRTVTGPTVGEEMVYVTRGMRGPLLAVELGKKTSGELTHRDIGWQQREGTPDTCCPVLAGNLLVMVSDNGVARCLDAHNGKLYWTARVKGGYKASPLYADGRFYFLNTSGLCTVVAASRKYDKLTENQVGDQTLASPAVSQGHIYLRGKKALYAIGR